MAVGGGVRDRARTGRERPYHDRSTAPAATNANRRVTECGCVADRRPHLVRNARISAATGATNDARRSGGATLFAAAAETLRIGPYRAACPNARGDFRRGAFLCNSPECRSRC